jgi:hypothetical protein
MALLRPRSTSHIAPHQLSSFTAPSLEDLPTTTPFSANLPSKVSPHMTPPPPLTSSRLPPPPSSQTPHCRARFITPTPQSNGPLNSGFSIPPHQTWQTVKKRKRAHLTPVSPSWELRLPSPPEIGLTSSLIFLTMKYTSLKIFLLKQVLPALSSPGNISRLPYMCTVLLTIRTWCPTCHI